MEIMLSEKNNPERITWIIAWFHLCSINEISQLSCVWFCDPMDGSPTDSSVHGILQARILGWVAIPFSRGSSRPRGRTWVSCITDRFFTICATREAQPYPSMWQNWGSENLNVYLISHSRWVKSRVLHPQLSTCFPLYGLIALEQKSKWPLDRFWPPKV